MRFGPVDKGSAEVVGIDDGLVAAFSSRRAAIEAALAAHGGRSRRAAEVAALATRPGKGSGLDEGLVGTPLHERWRAQARALGWEPVLSADVLGTPRAVAFEPEALGALTAHLLGPEGLTERSSVFERRDVVRSVAQALPDGGRLRDIEQTADRLLAHEHAVALGALGPGGEELCTTAELLAIERDLLERARAAQPGAVAMVDRAVVEAVLDARPQLADEQRRLVARLTTSGLVLDAAVGKAGSGKTAALEAAVAVWQASGRRVLGAALAARAADGLEHTTRVPCDTLAGLEARFARGETVLARHDVLLVDEAGMVGTRALARLVRAVETAHAKLVLVGDHRQLPEIDAGGAFAAVVGRLGAFELRSNRRQEAQWERACLDELRSGEVAEALRVPRRARPAPPAPRRARGAPCLGGRLVQGPPVGGLCADAGGHPGGHRRAQRLGPQRVAGDRCARA